MTMNLKKGFTLIELLVVLALLGIIMAGVLIAINPVQKMKQARDGRRKADIGQIGTALASYYTQNQSYPSLAQGLTQLGTASELKTVPTTPTGGSYTYAVTPAGCAGTAASPCTDVAVYDTLEVTTTDAWCYRTATGVASELVIASCVP